MVLSFVKKGENLKKKTLKILLIRKGKIKNS